MSVNNVSFSDQVTSIIEISGSATVLMVSFAVLCVLLGILVVRMFSNIWQSQAMKRRLFRDLIDHYNSDADQAVESEEE